MDVCLPRLRSCSANALCRFYRVYRITPNDDSQLAFLVQMYKKEAEMDVDFWKAPHAIGLSHPCCTREL